MNKKIAIITTHPIQYYAPLFAELSKNEQFEFKVFFTKGNPENSIFDKEFNKNIVWDIDILKGYNYEFLINSSKNAHKGGFWSIKNDDAIQKISDWGANAILIFGWNYWSHFKLMLHFKSKIPVFFRGDSTLLDNSSYLKSFVRKIILKYIYKHIDFAFAVGQCNKEYFLEYGLKANQVFIAPHCIDNQRFNTENDTFYFRKKLGISENDSVIIFCGKFINKKNPLILIKAFSELQKTNLHLVFVGNGELEADLKNYSKIYKNINFLDFQNQSTMPSVLKMANVLCLPSSGPGETWGLIVNEAMACGLPVVVSNKCGCYRDLVINEKSGYVFKYDSTEDLKSALEKSLELANQKDFAFAQKKYISQFSIENTALKINQIFKTYL